LSTKLGWFGVRDRKPTQVIEALKTLAQARRKLVPPEDGFRIASRQGNTAAVLLGWELAGVHDWAKATSGALDATTVSFFLLEGCWDFSIHHAGTRVAAMTWYPKRLPSLTGDMKQAARALDVPATLLSRYHEALLEVSEADEEASAVYACKGDKYDIGNEWAHCDLARRLGFVYPDTGKVTMIAAAR
jgi:hypothetical protein